MLVAGPANAGPFSFSSNWMEVPMKYLKRVLLKLWLRLVLPKIGVQNWTGGPIFTATTVGFRRLQIDLYPPRSTWIRDADETIEDTCPARKQQ